MRLAAKESETPRLALLARDGDANRIARRGAQAVYVGPEVPTHKERSRAGMDSEVNWPGPRCDGKQREAEKLRESLAGRCRDVRNDHKSR
jgi:hypothetical protein